MIGVQMIIKVDIYWHPYYTNADFTNIVLSSAV